MLLAEANQWPEDAVAYFGDGDSCHMAFHFPVMPRMFMALQMEDRYPVMDILEQTPAIPENCQWAIFLRNHDELTLEMVTDEERDYMYRMYANDHAGAHQPRHPPPPRPAARQQPAQDRTDQHPAVLAARHAHHLLRRRDRHGRQHLPRRPQRRPHADAMERGPQRRVLARQPAAALFPDHHRPGVPLRVDQRRKPGAQPFLAAQLDAPRHRDAAALSGVRARDDGVPAVGQHEGADVPAAARGRDHPRDRQPFAVRAGGGTRPARVRGRPAARGFQPEHISQGPLRHAVHADGRAARALLAVAGSRLTGADDGPSGERDAAGAARVERLRGSALQRRARASCRRRCCRPICRRAGGSAPRHARSCGVEVRRIAARRGIRRRAAPAVAGRGVHGRDAGNLRAAAANPARRGGGSRAGPPRRRASSPACRAAARCATRARTKASSAPCSRW